MNKLTKQVWLNKAKNYEKRHRQWKDSKKSRFKAKHEHLQNPKSVNYDYNSRHKDYVKVKAPKHFSFVDNSEEVSLFIQKLSNNFDKRKKVYVILRDVETLGYDALVVLIAIMFEFKINKIGFNGNIPKNRIAKQLLVSSGFIENLYLPITRKNKYDIAHSSRIYTHAQKMVDSELSAKIIGGATNTVWKRRRRCQGVQRAFLELMQNTTEHAELNATAKKYWWVSVFHDKKLRKATFTFVDFGVGIFTSLENKKATSKFYRWKTKVKNILTFTSNADLMKLILEGRLHQTVTNQPFRGKGLPGLKTLYERNALSNLHIISNNVKVDVPNDQYLTLRNDFNGTFVYWELYDSNKNCDAAA